VLVSAGRGVSVNNITFWKQEEERQQQIQSLGGKEQKKRVKSGKSKKNLTRSTITILLPSSPSPPEIPW
jgi:hypothetical protein